MSVDPDKTAHKAEHDGLPFYFCSAGCRTKFLADPGKYLAPEKLEVRPVTKGTIYNCPMHP